MNNAQKTPLSKSLNFFAQNKAFEAISQLGLALPGHVESVSGAIVTVQFDVTDFNLPQVSMPLFGPTYIRYPIQQGDLGVAFPCSVSIGYTSGLGAAQPTDSSPVGNLAALVWFPIGNKNWASVDPNAVTVTGFSGVNMYAPNVQASQNLSVGNGASGVFTTPTGQTVTVVNGIITNIA